MSSPGSSIDQVFDVLNLLSARSEPTGVAEIARGLEIPNSTAHRVIITLVEAGYASRDTSGAKYQLGPAAQEMAHALLGRFPVGVAGQASLSELAMDTGATAILVVRVGWYAVRIAGAEGWREIHAAPRLGQTSLLEHSLGGLAILSLLDPEMRRRYMAWRPRKGAKQLRDRLEVRDEAGFSVERHDDGRYDLAIATSAPSGGVDAAVAVEGAGPEGGVRAERSLGSRVRAAAREIEALMAEQPEAARDPFGYLSPEDLDPGFDPAPAD